MPDAPLDGSRIWSEFFGLSSTDFITPLAVDECVARIRESSDPWWSLAPPGCDVAARTSASADRAKFSLRKTLMPIDYLNRSNRQFTILLDGRLEHDGTVTRIRCRTRTSYPAYALLAGAGVVALVMVWSTAMAAAAAIGGEAGAWALAGRVGLVALVVAVLPAVSVLSSLERARSDRAFLLAFVRECLQAEDAPR